MSEKLSTFPRFKAGIPRVVDVRSAILEKLIEIANESGPRADATRKSYRASLDLIDTVSISRTT